VRSLPLKRETVLSGATAAVLAASSAKSGIAPAETSRIKSGKRSVIKHLMDPLTVQRLEGNRHTLLSGNVIVPLWFKILVFDIGRVP